MLPSRQRWWKWNVNFNFKQSNACDDFFGVYFLQQRSTNNIDLNQKFQNPCIYKRQFNTGSMCSVLLIRAPPYAIKCRLHYVSSNIRVKKTVTLFYSMKWIDEVMLFFNAHTSRGFAISNNNNTFHSCSPFSHSLHSQHAVDTWLFRLRSCSRLRRNELQNLECSSHECNIGIHTRWLSTLPRAVLTY